MENKSIIIKTSNILIYYWYWNIVFEILDGIKEHTHISKTVYKRNFDILATPFLKT